MNFFRGKTVLVTGGTGSIGSEIVRQILAGQPKVVRIYSRDESKQFALREELRDFSNVRYLIGDVRDIDRLTYAMDEVDLVYHAAAMKHVPAAEYNPFEAVKTNVLGTQNVIEASLQHNVERVVAISTDKAANPSNTMGATKLLMEKLITSANLYRGSKRTVFSCVRFGNVMGSNGSVIPLFVKQALEGRPLTVTEPNMTRFMMSIPQAVSLVLTSSARSFGGEIMILKMPVVQLASLAEIVGRRVCDLAGIPFQGVSLIGLRPGEKIYEELMTEEESTRALELDDMYVILPEVHNRLESAWAREGRVPAEGAYSSRAIPTLDPEATLELVDPIIQKLLKRV